MNIVSIATIKQAELPTWAKRVFTGVSRGKNIDPARLIIDTWLHDNQRTKNFTRGHDIAAALVKGFVLKDDASDKVYEVAPDDLIHGHFGIAEIDWIDENWKSLPEEFTEWASERILYAWADVVRDEQNRLRVPFINCRQPTRGKAYCPADRIWNRLEPALRDTEGKAIAIPDDEGATVDQFAKEGMRAGPEVAKK